MEWKSYSNALKKRKHCAYNTQLTDTQTKERHDKHHSVAR